MRTAEHPTKRNKQELAGTLFYMTPWPPSTEIAGSPRQSRSCRGSPPRPQTEVGQPSPDSFPPMQPAYPMHPFSRVNPS